MAGAELRKYLRGRTWWVKGRIEGVDHYYRESLGTSDAAVAEAEVDRIKREARKRAILGVDAPSPEDELTFSSAVMLHHSKPRDALYLAKILPHLGSTKVKEINSQTIKRLARRLYPTASTDTWHRQVVVPVRSVINNAHEEGLCAPLRVKAFSKNERMQQDRVRGKDSRVPKQPGSWEWALAFAEHADPRCAAMALFMFTKGARISQVLEMRDPQDMDLQNFRLRLPAAKGHPAQWVTVLPIVAVAIANIPKPRGKVASKRVFKYGGGRSGWLYEEWRRACTAAGIPYLSPHAQGRHGFGTETIVRQSVDPATAARDGRWASAKVMLDTYSHPDETGVRVRDAFAAGLEAARTKPVQEKSEKPAKAAENKG